MTRSIVYALNCIIFCIITYKIGNNSDNINIIKENYNNVLLLINKKTSIIIEQINIEPINKKNTSLIIHINNNKFIYTNITNYKFALEYYIHLKSDNGYLLYNQKHHEEGKTKIYFLEFIENLYNINLYKIKKYKIDIDDDQ